MVQVERGGEMNKYQEALNYLVGELKGCDEAISDPEYRQELTAKREAAEKELQKLIDEVGHKEIISARTLVGCWIPVDEKLPANEDKVLICTITKTGNKNVLVGYYSPDLRRWVCGMNSNVITWQPLPEPYAEISTND